MSKYFSFKVAGYYLYFTSKCIIEAFHVHASYSKLTEESSANFAAAIRIGKATNAG